MRHKCQSSSNLAEQKRSAQHSWLPGPPIVSSHICGVMVTYNPDGDVISNVDAAIEQLGFLVIVDNGSDANLALDSHLLSDDRVVQERLPHNQGIASALNIGIQMASELGYDWVLTLDQDSTLQHNCVKAMIAALEADSREPKYVMIGANYQDRQGPQLRHCREIITSGTLMPVKLTEKLGPFREDFFIDMVDIEMCWRVRKAGYRIGCATDAHMNHKLGDSKSLPLIGLITVHPPFRNYYRFRNTVLLLREVGTSDLTFSLRRVLKMTAIAIKNILFARPTPQQIRAIFIGVSDGVRGVSGICNREYF